RIGLFPLLFVQTISIFVCRINVAYRLRMLVSLRVINQYAKQVAVIGGLGADINQKWIVVSALGGGDRINKVRSRTSDLPDLIQNGENRTFTVRRLSLGADRLVLHVHRESYQ